MKSILRLLRAGLLAAALGLAACATSTEPFEYQSYNETKPGRGAFTGEKGTWTIYRQEMPSESRTAPAEDNRDQTGNEVSADRSDAGAPPAPD